MNENQTSRVNSSLIEIIKLYQQIVNEVSTLNTILIKETKTCSKETLASIEDSHFNYKLKLRKVQRLIESVKDDLKEHKITLDVTIH